MIASTLTHPQFSRAPVFDAELISRYDVNGPRYTSSPTAPQFHAQFAEYRPPKAVVGGSNPSGRANPFVTISRVLS
ncbi:hypothetical protein [Dokdonella sp.]|uniref:hypothetical protein n=1 Tax=Dokdonella sp. TaxID=2291710 RepID=UPI003C3F4C75